MSLGPGGGPAVARGHHKDHLVRVVRERLPAERADDGVQRRGRVAYGHDDGHHDAGRCPGAPATALAGAAGVERLARYRGLWGQARHITHNEPCPRWRRG